jgi:hypothetical protein
LGPSAVSYRFSAFTLHSVSSGNWGFPFWSLWKFLLRHLIRFVRSVHITSLSTGNENLRSFQFDSYYSEDLHLLGYNRHVVR